MKVKFAYIVFSLPFPFPWEIGNFNFDDHTNLHEGSIKDQVQGPDSKHWAEWLGSITWQALCEKKLILSTWAESNNCEVLDSENEALQSKISTIFRILPLVAALCPPSDEVFIFSGKGEVSDEGLRAEDIRTFSRVNCWITSYYYSSFWDEFHSWAKNEIMKPALLEDWKTCYSHYNRLFIQGNTNRQLFEGYRSFEEAMRGTQLEFKIPNLVRALECVIECYGAKEFADKVLFLAGNPNVKLPYSISNNTKDLLYDLYQMRNDCSHGKPFAFSLEKKMGKVPDGTIIAQYEFLAEWAARKVLNDSFTNQSILKHTKDRDTLVEAWKKKLIQC